MKTVVLAASQSNRFWPLTHKPLFPLCGKPLLAHIIHRLAEAGCDDIICVVSPETRAAIAALCPSALLVEQEDREAGMQGALLSALPHIGEDEVCIVGGNDLVDADAYRATIQQGRSAGRDGALLAWRTANYFPGGYLSVTDDRVTHIVEKPGEEHAPSDLVTIVCHHYRNASQLLAALRTVTSNRDDGYEVALAQCLTTGSFAPVVYEGPWQAVKYPWHILDMLPHLLTSIESSVHPSAEVHPSAVLQGPIVLEEGVRILPHASIVGPAYIGKGTIIGNNALVRHSSIGEHCVIGYNTEVKSCVLGDHVWTHSTYLGDSVIGHNVAFGAGTVTGNFRLDESPIPSTIHEEPVQTGRVKLGSIIGDNVRIGIHTSLFPGSKIGSGTFIAGASVVDRDVPNDSFARMKEGVLVVRPNKTSAPNPAKRMQFRTEV